MFQADTDRPVSPADPQREEPSSEPGEGSLVELKAPSAFAWVQTALSGQWFTGLAEREEEEQTAPPPKPELLDPARLEQCKTEIPDLKDWPSLKDDLAEVMRTAFEKGRRLSPNGSHLRWHLGGVDGVFILLRDHSTGKAIGYTYGFPRSVAMPKEEGKERKYESAVYIFETAIHSKYQGNGLIGKLMSAFESECRNQGHSYICRDSAVYNGYADKVARHYGDRVVSSYDHPSIYGPQRYFLITLAERPAKPATTTAHEASGTAPLSEPEQPEDGAEASSAS